MPISLYYCEMLRFMGSKQGHVTDFYVKLEDIPILAVNLLFAFRGIDGLFLKPVFNSKISKSKFPLTFDYIREQARGYLREQE